MLRPSGETATDVTEDLCPSRVARNSPLSASKTCMMRSVGAGHAAVAEMMLRPSGEYVTELLRKGRPFTFRVIRHSAPVSHRGRPPPPHASVSEGTPLPSSHVMSSSGVLCSAVCTCMKLSRWCAVGVSRIVHSVLGFMV
eukprot:CAMPEP_0175832612 /NCGR_PEP_ID=MMETSP0107_2-20121207/15080_1 /TAXON_ID=195067 ORGANISM="Goniomonas pacifica, Strain CCMP1869" /NCGR_SAMPLE_ID=MMETSP0107_2 /ASSEMBLY_ACC=CAM_ASM_000203 /LENGTH=139 /DNA_ID=CAMNT_0017145707 /DNA_START=558 /DNA_END=977 /DNA_ORIENTATION=-